MKANFLFLLNTTLIRTYVEEKKEKRYAFTKEHTLSLSKTNTPDYLDLVINQWLNINTCITLFIIIIILISIIIVSIYLRSVTYQVSLSNSQDIMLLSFMKSLNLLSITHMLEKHVDSIIFQIQSLKIRTPELFYVLFQNSFQTFGLEQ